jgi:hypothetical protein
MRPAASSRVVRIAILLICQDLLTDPHFSPRSIISGSALAVSRESSRPCWRQFFRIRKAGIRRSRARCYAGVSGAFCDANKTRTSPRSCFETQNDPRKRLRLTRSHCLILTGGFCMYVTCAREQSPGRVSRRDARADSRRETRRR